MNLQQPLRATAAGRGAGAAGILVVLLAASSLAAPVGVVRASMVGTAVLLVTGVVLRRALRASTGERTCWWPVTITVAAHGLGMLVRALPDDIVPTRGAASYALHVIALVALTVALTIIVRRQAGRDLHSLPDAAAIGASATVAAWVLLVEPLRPSLPAAPGGAVLHMALLLAGVLALVALWRALTMLQRVSPAVGAVLVGSVLSVLGALLTGARALAAAPAVGVGTDLLAVATLAMYGLAATLSSAPHPAEGPRGQRQRTPLRRVAGLATASLLLPGTLLLRAESHLEVLVALAIALVLLVVTLQVWLLLRRVAAQFHLDIARQRSRDERRFEAMVRHTTDVLLVLDRHRTVTWASPSAVAMFGDSPVGWTQHRIAAEIHPAERVATMEALVNRLAEGNGRPIHLNARLRDLDGQRRHIELIAVDLLRDPDVRGLVLTVRETTARTTLEAELRRLAFHDTLTGLANRDLFNERLARALQRASRTGRRVAVLLCDLDDFKDVNDTLGHPAGDQLLQALARRFEGAVRVTDTVARLGGDEFAVLCEDLDLAKDAVSAAQHLLNAATERPITIEGRDLQVGLSIGIAVDVGERTADELLRDADIALYEAKAQGKRRWSLHRAAMTAHARARLQLTADLARTVADGALDVVFQPIVALGSNELVGVEALARWTHPTRGVISPPEFIGLAEGNDLILELGQLVLQHTLAARATWRDEHPDLALQLAVNVSARQLRDAHLADRVGQLLDAYEVAPGDLILELTESAMLEDADQVLTVVHALRQLGVRFAIDDFGTGFSSLSHLRTLPVDIVKVDRSFVTELSPEGSTYDLVKAIVDLGATLHLEVAAEGVETSEQQALLRGLGCDLGQGYLFASPTGVVGMSRLLRTWSALTPYTGARWPGVTPALATPPVAAATAPVTTGPVAPRQ